MFRIGLGGLVLPLCLAGCGIAGSGDPEDGDIAKIYGTARNLRQVVADCDPKEFYDLESPVERAQRTPTSADLALAKKQLCPDYEHRDTQMEALRMAVWKGSVDFNGDANATIYWADVGPGGQLHFVKVGDRWYLGGNWDGASRYPP